MNLLTKQKIKLWDNFEKSILSHLVEALIELRKEFDNRNMGQDTSEEEFSRCLEKCIHKTAFLRRKNQELFEPPFYDAKNPVTSDFEELSKHREKRPDFQWRLFDKSAENPEHFLVAYTVECKLLGFKPSRKLFDDYIDDGIERFISKTHRYAENYSSAAMIAYCVYTNGLLTDVLTAINEGVESKGISKLVLDKEGWQPLDVSLLKHQLIRRFSPHQNLVLSHLWLDLNLESTK